MFVIGTAGHVDHGKSALVRALTGIDPDRLQEEKDRGMTIDLGFAWLKLPGGMEVSIVDVPGHERFIKNMLAGVGGIDLALLVVAADEGVMPQTREHLAILDLLGVNRGILVLTKSDLVEPDWLDMVGAELEDVVSSTTLAGSPLVKCSTKTGDGLAELISVIETRLAETPPKRDLGRPRLHVDRVFTVSGFGTVVTGTLIDGTLNLGQEVEVVPAIEGGHLTTLPARVRGLQSHKSKVEQSEPGSRTAANLAGVDRDQLHRGQVVTTAGWLKPSLAVDVQLRSLETLTHTLRHNLPVTFHTFSSEAPGVLRLLDADELLPGDTAWAQVRLKQPLAVLTGDRFIIRDANETIGGGTIIATQAKRHPRRRESVLTELARLEKGDPADTVYSLIAEKEPVDLEATIRQTDLTREVALAAAESLIESGRIVRLGPADSRLLYTSAGLEKLRRAASTATTAYLAEHPLRPGIPKEELRSRLKLSARNFNLLLEALPSEGGLKDAGVVIAPEDWAPQLTPVQQQTIDAYLALLKENPKAPDTEHRPDDALVVYLVEQGTVVDAGNGVVFDAGAYREMVDAIVGLFTTQESVTLAQVRDLLGTSRRYVQALLEHMDSERITIRRGDERVLRRSV